MGIMRAPRSGSAACGGHFGKRSGRLLAAALLAGLCGVRTLPAAPANGTAEPAAGATGQALSNRWFFAFGYGLDSDASLQSLMGLADTAAKHGLNGMVLTADLTSISQWPPADRERLIRLKARCAADHIDLIPCVMSVGYGDGVDQINRNLVEGLPVRNMPLVVRNGLATVAGTPPLTSADGSFETARGNQVRGFQTQDGPGTLTVVDSTQAKVGHNSLRFECAQSRVRLTFNPLTEPDKYYVLRFWAKAENLKPASITLCDYDETGFQVNRVDYRVKNGADWQKFEYAFFTSERKQAQLFLGVWSAKKGGRFWIDGVELFEPGFVNVLRRPGTPVVITRRSDGATLTEGQDYEKIVDRNLKPGQAWHEPPAVRVVPGGRIREGDALLASFYAPSFLAKNQRVLCMSEPEVYSDWHKAVDAIQEAIHPTAWFLDMDEIRACGTCAACRERKDKAGRPLTPTQILDDCVQQQVAMIRTANPKAEVAIWGDMFDPTLGAAARYYTVPGGFAGSWKDLPKDLIIVPWILSTADASLKHFGDLGFRTVGGAYYDADDLDGVQKWLTALRTTPKASGILYTSWERKYDLLGPFGDLVSRPAP